MGFGRIGKPCGVSQWKLHFSHKERSTQMEKEDSKELMEEPLAAMGLAQDEGTLVY